MRLIIKQAIIWFAFIGSVVGCAYEQPKPAEPQSRVANPPKEKTTRVGVWQPPAGLVQLPIWPGAAPDNEKFHNRPESILTNPTPNALVGGISEAALDVTVPTMTVFPPKGRNTGTAIIVFPGGGYRAVVVTLQGTEVCDWVTARGMTCILLKYRVPQSGHHYDAACDCGVEPKVRWALQDAQRTIRLVRSKAGELGVNPQKIGVMGFSAGGYLAVQTSNIFESVYTPVDATDMVSSRPDFALTFYAGHLCRPGNVLDPSIRPTVKTPPTFVIQAWDDPVNSICNATLYARALADANVPAEVHLFAKGGHAFALRKLDHPVSGWPRLVEDWLREIGVQ
jgi:acetyl esterase/lipase